MAEQDDKATPLSPLEIKLAAIAAAKAARENSSHTPALPVIAVPPAAPPEEPAETVAIAEVPTATEPAPLEHAAVLAGEQQQTSSESTLESGADAVETQSAIDSEPTSVVVSEAPATVRAEAPPALPTESQSAPTIASAPAVAEENISLAPAADQQLAEAETAIVPEAGLGTAPLVAPITEGSVATYDTAVDDSHPIPASALRSPAVVDPNAPIETESRVRVSGLAAPKHRHSRRFEAEYAATAGLLGAVLVIGLATVNNYAITPEEFKYDDIGTRLLSLYGGGERDSVAASGSIFAQWFQVLTAAVQSFVPGHRFDVRHALTFLVGLGGLAALLPLGRIAIGRWAGLTAIVLCLLTGNFYGHLFFSPVDVPFMAAMTWATLAIVLMARRVAPGWAAVIAAGLFTGLAVATRPAGLLSHLFLIAAMLLCAFEAVFRSEVGTSRALLRIGLQTFVALVLSWIVAIALLPTLHGANLLQGLRSMFTAPSDQGPASIVSWGRELPTSALPWHYLPGELLVRLSGVFVVLLGLALLMALGFLVLFIVRRRHHHASLRDVGTPTLMFFLLVRSRAALVVTLAAVLPILIVMIARPQLYDGIRLVLFIVPPLALLAAWALLRLTPLIRAFPIIAAVLIGAQIGGGVLVLASQHPLEYITTNAFAGGTRGSYARFELDYWGAAATEALRKLEQRLDYDRSTRFASEPPHILLCPYASEYIDTGIFKRGWGIAEGPTTADFIIETRKSRCGQDAGGKVIDEVKRRDQPFAWTLELPASTTPRDEISD